MLQAITLYDMKEENRRFRLERPTRVNITKCNVML